MQVPRTYTDKQEPRNQRDKGVVNPFRPLVKVRSDRDNNKICIFGIDGK